MPWASSTWITPTCAKPLAAPPPKAKPKRTSLRSTLGSAVPGAVGGAVGTLLQAANTITSDSRLQRPSPLIAATPRPVRHRFFSLLALTDNIFSSNLIDNDSHLNYTSGFCNQPLYETMNFTRSILSLACLMTAVSTMAQDKVLNIYSARHYPSDEVMYSEFTKATGIKINRVDADDAGILARLKAEGAASPADVILLVDAARLWRAEIDGLFLPIKSDRKSVV